MRNAIIGTAGHIDHGKTTLVKALTGIDADRLEEEKRRGITIDIGFAHMQVDDWRLGFVDVPGHEKFVKNMLAGIGGIDIALLVVAADESIMPQTVEHFQICRLLQIPAGVIALSKKANVDEELLELVSEEVGDLVKGSFLEKAPVVAVDSLTGEGIEALKAEIVRIVEATKGRSRSSETCFRLPIDRVFTIRGFGTVVTGTPTNGEIQVEKVLQAYPGEERCKVRGLEIFNQKTTIARAGQRTALNISGVERQAMRRGMVLAPPGVFEPSYMFDVEVELLSDAPSPLKDRAPVRFHHGSAELLGRLHLLDRRVLERGDVGLAQVRLDTPAIGCLFDRFILRRYSPMTTIGGGVILDAQPAKHRRRDLDRLVPEMSSLVRELREQGRASLGHFISYYVRMSGIDGLDLDRLVSRTGVLPGALEPILSASAEIVLVPVDPPLAVAESSLEGLGRTIIEFLEAFHERKPLSTGASKEEVKRRFLEGGSNAYFQFVLERLARNGGVRLESGRVSLASNEVLLSAEQEELQGRLLDMIETTGWNPPGLAQLPDLLSEPGKNVREIFYFLLGKGTIVKVSEDIVLTDQRVERLVEKTRASFADGTAFSVSDFKNLLGVSRKFAIPYLEYLDRNGVTQRVGDRRMIKL